MYSKIKNRASRAILYTKSTLRIKHFRGHGIHSPFVYSIIREVFMKYKFATDDRVLYTQLRKELCDRRSARQLQNLYNHCSHSSFFIFNSNKAISTEVKSDIIVVSSSIDTQHIDAILERYLNIGTPVVVIYPRSNKRRLMACNRHIDREKYLSIDNRRFMLFYCDDKLPRQHFKL